MDDDQKRELVMNTSWNYVMIFYMEEENDIIPRRIRSAEDIVDVIPAEYELEDVVQPNYEESEPGEQEDQEIPTVIPPKITVINKSDSRSKTLTFVLNQDVGVDY
jgi:hypothetical protein